MAKRVVKKIAVYTASGMDVRRKAIAKRTGGAMIPEDMLRYDQAFTCDERFPGVVIFPTYTVKGRGISKGDPTLARWQSFLIKLSASLDLDGEIADSLLQHPEEWVTYHHPAGNYEKLDPKTYKQFTTEEV